MKKLFLFVLLIFCILMCIVFYQFFHFYDNKLHIVFCNVGQGDGIFIKTPGGSTMLVDGGPDNSIINCLGKYMPFWQRNLSLVILTHPHADHLQGLLYVFDRYHVANFATEDLKNTTYGFKTLMQKMQDENTPKRYLKQGDSIDIGNVGLSIIGPTENFLHTTSPTGIIGGTKEFASIETLVSFGNFRALLTGDSQADELHVGVQSIEPLHLSVLQVPHHGSASGLDREVLDSFQPDLAVISVGLHNLYHHPNPFTLSLLKEQKIPIKRTDQVGDVEVVSDGKMWWID